jgi:hypothetical protein
MLLIVVIIAILASTAWHRLPGGFDRPASDRRRAELRLRGRVPRNGGISFGSVIVVRRLSCNRRLRDAAYYWAHNAIRHDATSQAKYNALRARGHGHARALRSVADRLLYVACAMLKKGTLFDRSLASKKSANGWIEFNSRVTAERTHSPVRWLEGLTDY